MRVILQGFATLRGRILARSGTFQELESRLKIGVTLSATFTADRLSQVGRRLPCTTSVRAEHERLCWLAPADSPPQPSSGVSVVVIRNGAKSFVDPVVRRTVDVGDRAQPIDHLGSHRRRWIGIVHLPNDHRHSTGLALGDPAGLIIQPPSRDRCRSTQFAVRRVRHDPCNCCSVRSTTERNEGRISRPSSRVRDRIPTMARSSGTADQGRSIAALTSATYAPTASGPSSMRRRITEAPWMIPSATRVASYAC